MAIKQASFASSETTGTSMAADVYVTGMSHTQAFLSALPDYRGPVRFEIDNLNAPANKGVVGSNHTIAQKEFFDGKLDAKLVAVAFYGGWYNALAMFEFGEPFDFILPGFDEEVIAGRRIVPFTQIQRKFRNYLRHRMKVLTSFRSLTSAPMVYLEPPPPVPADHILRHPHPFEAEIPRGVAPASVRKKLWKLQSRCIAEICEEIDVAFLAVDERAFDREGLLAEEFRYPDPAHANAAYGALVLKRLEDIVLGGGLVGDRPASVAAENPRVT